MNLPKIGVLVSGRSGGTNFQAILDAITRNELHVKVALLVATDELHGAVARARAANIKTLVLPPGECDSAEAWDHQVSDALYQQGVAVVCLAGYLRLITHVLLEAFPGRILNVHPALLPAFGGKGMYGLHVHQAVLEYGAKVSGCTVHLVDEAYDTGPVIVQRPVPVEENDTPETLAARILPHEHKAFIEALQLLSENRLQVVGRRVHVLPSNTVL